MTTLTNRQHELMLFIQRTIIETGLSPTVQECAEAIHVARGATHAHIAALIERGFVRKTPQRKRSLEVVKPIPDDRFFDAVATNFPGVTLDTIDAVMVFEYWCKEHRAKGFKYRGPKLVIPTLEGEMTADAGDWIIKGVAGEFYPCKPDIFVATYEPVQP